MGKFGRSFRSRFPCTLVFSKSKRLQGIPKGRLRTLSEKQLCGEHDRYPGSSVLEKGSSIAAFIKDVGICVFISLKSIYACCKCQRWRIVGIEMLCVFFSFCFVFLELAVKSYAFSPADSDSL